MNRAPRFKTSQEYRTWFNDVYRHTPHWQRVREAMIADRGGRCESCGTARRLTVHHVSYDNLGDELGHLGDLQLLCFDCHNRVEAAKAEARRPKGHWAVELVREIIRAGWGS